MTDDVISPYADESVSRDTDLAQRLGTLDGATIGLFSNAKKNADLFLECVGDHLSETYDVEFGPVIYKEMSPSAAEDEVYEELSTYDAVLIAYGDCGSCSSWTIHDALQLESMGVPTVVYCTEEFTTLCQYESENRGAPGLPIVELLHPVADLDEETIQAERVTAELIDLTVDALTTDPTELFDVYAGRYTGTDVGASPS